MRFSRTPLLTVALSLSVFAVSSAHAATILTFDGVGGNGASVPAVYGDFVASATQDGYTYGTDGNGFTPNVSTSFDADWKIWNSSYSGTAPVIWPNNNGNPALTLTADPGYTVTLNSITLGRDGNTTAQVTVIVDGVQQYQNTFLGNEGFYPYLLTLNLTGQSIVVTPGAANNGNISFDNINFSQAAEFGPIPEPASLSLAVLGLAALLSRRTSRR